MPSKKEEPLLRRVTDDPIAFHAVHRHYIGTGGRFLMDNLDLLASERLISPLVTCLLSTWNTTRATRKLSASQLQALWP